VSALEYFVGDVGVSERVRDPADPTSFVVATAVTSRPRSAPSAATAPAANVTAGSVPNSRQATTASTPAATTRSASLAVLGDERRIDRSAATGPYRRYLQYRHRTGLEFHDALETRDADVVGTGLGVGGRDAGGRSLVTGGRVE